MKTFMIDQKNEGKKIFRFIKSILPVLKNTEIFRLIRKKIITVNDKKISDDYILKEKDIVTIFLKEDHFSPKHNTTKFSAVNRKLNIIYEDNDLLVINKPAGLLSHPDKDHYQNNLYEAARSYLYARGEYRPDDLFTPAPCHRLDKNTSGILVIAKNHISLQKITALLRNRQAVKMYQSIVYSRITAPVLLVSRLNTKDEKVKVADFTVITDIPEKTAFLQKNPLLSATLITPLQTSSDCSLITIDLWTGKKHQIRVHLTHYDHPLLGDKKYFTTKSVKTTRHYHIISYFLHSYKLHLPGYPEWTAPLPDAFDKTVKQIFHK